MKIIGHFFHHVAGSGVLKLLHRTYCTYPHRTELCNKAGKWSLSWRCARGHSSVCPTVHCYKECYRTKHWGWWQFLACVTGTAGIYGTTHSNTHRGIYSYFWHIQRNFPMCSYTYFLPNTFQHLYKNQHIGISNTHRGIFQCIPKHAAQFFQHFLEISIDFIFFL